MQRHTLLVVLSIAGSIVLAGCLDLGSEEAREGSTSSDTGDIAPPSGCLETDTEDEPPSEDDEEIECEESERVPAAG